LAVAKGLHLTSVPVFEIIQAGSGEGCLSIKKLIKEQAHDVIFIPKQESIKGKHWGAIALS
jgi:hypothetical protein